MNKNTVKSIGAVLAGFLIVVVLSVATDAFVEAIGFLPPATQPEALTSGHLVIALIYRTVYTILGGYVTARLAPSNPGEHVMALGILGTIGGIMGVLAGWNLSENWYPIALAVLAYPSVWFGGQLRMKQIKKK